MTAKLSSDLQREIDQHPGRPVRVEHPGTRKLYVIVDNDIHERAMRALKEQEDWTAVQQGLKQREQGLGQPVAEVDAEIRDEFGFPPRA